MLAPHKPLSIAYAFQKTSIGTYHNVDRYDEMHLP